MAGGRCLATTPRKLGPFLATMFVTGNIVGSGLFLLPATLGALGGISVLSWLLATLGALLIAGVYARLGVLAPWSGGPFAYAHVLLGRLAGFQTNYVYWLSGWIGNVAIALAVTGYLGEFLPLLHAQPASTVCTLLVIWSMVLLNVAGPRAVGGLETLALALGLGPVLAIGVVGWWWFDGHLFMASWNVSGQSVAHAVPASLILVFWAFLGLETAAVAADVVENPRRNLPLAALAGVAIAAVIYAACCTVLMGIVPAPQLAASSAPFALVAARLFGTWAGLLVSLGAILKTTGSLSGWVLVVAATAKAAAEAGSFPRVFAHVDARGIPVRNLLLHGALMTLAVLATLSPTLGQQFNRLVDVTAVFSMVIYACSAVALLRMSALTAAGTGAHRLRDRLLAMLALAFSLWVILASDTPLLLIAVAIMATSLPLYAFYARRSTQTQGDPPAGPGAVVLSPPHPP